MMIILSLLIYITVLLCAIGAWCDFKKLEIPNAIPLSIGVLFIAAVCIQEFAGHQFILFESLSQNILACFIVFTITIILFSFNALGAGDSKLLTVLALWTGFQGLPILLFWMALSGALLSAMAIYVKRSQPKWLENSIIAPKDSWLYQIKQGRNAVPYAVAIFAGLIPAFSDNGFFTIFWG